jgi:hypothetical protein
MRLDKHGLRPVGSRKHEGAGLRVMANQTRLATGLTGSECLRRSQGRTLGAVAADGSAATSPLVPHRRCTSSSGSNIMVGPGDAVAGGPDPVAEPSTAQDRGNHTSTQAYGASNV